MSATVHHFWSFFLVHLLQNPSNTFCKFPLDPFLGVYETKRGNGATEISGCIPLAGPGSNTKWNQTETWEKSNPEPHNLKLYESFSPFKATFNIIRNSANKLNLSAYVHLQLCRPSILRYMDRNSMSLWSLHMVGLPSVYATISWWWSRNLFMVSIYFFLLWT